MQFDDDKLRSMRIELVGMYSDNHSVVNLPVEMQEHILHENERIGSVITRITRHINLIEREMVRRFCEQDKE